MQLNELINNMSRSHSYIMKGVLMGTFLASVFGLNKPGATVVIGAKNLVNKASRKLSGSNVTGYFANLVEV